MALALEEAGASPDGIDYVAYHGTGTLLNDRVETRAMRRAFGGAAARLPGSSIKSMIGHPQGACGAAAVAATVLGMRDGFLPPTINLETADPECDLDYVPNTARQQRVEYVLSNSFGFGGTNGCLILKRMD
jgi:3-oxoacyl-[acyl-carrier-protein] synthase II